MKSSLLNPKSLLLFLVVMASFVTTHAAKADTVYLQDTTTSGMSREDAVTVNDLLRASIGEMGKHQIVADPKQARFVLKPKLIKLGTAYMLTLEKTEGGNMKFSSQMKAQKIEELDGVVSRLARSVLDEVPVKDDIRVKEVTEAETLAGTRRREVLKRWYLGFGPAVTSNLNSSNTGFSGQIAYTWELTASSAAIRLFWDGAAGLSYFGLGGNYFIKDTDASPFVGADLGYGGSTVQGNPDTSVVNVTNVSGFALGATAGYTFFRTSSVNLEVALRFVYMMSKNYYGNPTMTALRVGLLF